MSSVDLAQMKDEQDVKNAAKSRGKDSSDHDGSHQLFIASRQLAARWDCSRSQVDVIARRAGLRRVCLGEGRNGMVRYLLDEVEALERSRQVPPGPSGKCQN
ncbi:MAG: hypothetical protein WC869_02025 [Phycisphaerae bacterium]|jgi:hypothetical protein